MLLFYLHDLEAQAWLGSSTCICWDLQRKSETKALLNSGILMVYIMGFTRELQTVKPSVQKVNVHMLKQRGNHTYKIGKY